jgi:hypothetical protein
MRFVIRWCSVWSGLLVLASSGCGRAPAEHSEDRPIQVASPAPGEAIQLPLGAIVDGRLERGDLQLSDESLGDDYALMLTEGQPVTVVTRGGALAEGEGTLDVMTILLFNDREVAMDDDSALRGEARNSRIVYSPPVSGLYVLRVTSSGAGVHHGSYQLQTYTGGLLRQL